MVVWASRAGHHRIRPVLGAISHRYDRPGFGLQVYFRFSVGTWRGWRMERLLRGSNRGQRATEVQRLISLCHEEKHLLPTYLCASTSPDRTFLQFVLSALRMPHAHDIRTTFVASPRRTRAAHGRSAVQEARELGRVNPQILGDSIVHEKTKRRGCVYEGTHERYHSMNVGMGLLLIFRFKTFDRQHELLTNKGLGVIWGSDAAPNPWR
jgi:hypothetical protein